MFFQKLIPAPSFSCGQLLLIQTNKKQSFKDMNPAGLQMAAIARWILNLQY